MEAYPELKANENVASLTEELTTTENRVAFARQAYNDWVMGYNTFRESVPAVFFAPPWASQKTVLSWRWTTVRRSNKRPSYHVLILPQKP